MLRHVGHPELVWGLRLEVPFDKIRVSESNWVSTGAAPVLSAMDSGEAGQPHEPSYSLSGAPDSAAEFELGMYPGSTVDAMTLLVNRRDPLGQLSVLLGPYGRFPPPPSVVPAGGDTQHTAHRFDGVVLLLLLDKQENRYDVLLIS